MIHNAPFDIGFLNAEFSRCGHPPLSMERVIDTLSLAREKYPGAQASLDALCRRFDVDNSHRDLHGALIDADLLASVFVELKGGRQPGLKLDDGIKTIHQRIIYLVRIQIFLGLFCANVLCDLHAYSRYLMLKQPHIRTC